MILRSCLLWMAIGSILLLGVGISAFIFVIYAVMFMALLLL